MQLYTKPLSKTGYWIGSEEARAWEPALLRLAGSSSFSAEAAPMPPE
jgi:hypothetical protein